MLLIILGGLMGELLYHVDENDKVIGSVEREVAHEILLLHRSGMVFLRNSRNKYFITRRANKPTFPNVFDTASSFHVTYGESYDQAVRREFKEETGIETNFRYLGKFVHKDPPEYEMVVVYLAESDKSPFLDPNESLSGEWKTLEEVEKMVAGGNVTPWLRDGFKLLKGKLID
jgi:isopentenyldiphosphate isomerase